MASLEQILANAAASRPFEPPPQAHPYALDAGQQGWQTWGGSADSDAPSFSNADATTTAGFMLNGASQGYPGQEPPSPDPMQTSPLGGPVGQTSFFPPPAPSAAPRLDLRQFYAKYSQQLSHADDQALLSVFTAVSHAILPF
jgi:hypothetical protein